MGRDRLIVIKGNKAEDTSDLVSSVKWEGRKGSAGRSLTVTLLDDSGFEHDRSGIDVEEGHQCVYYRDGKELFRGMFMLQSQSHTRNMTAKAYDNGIRLANNEDTFNYTNEKASNIFMDCCRRFGIPYDAKNIADTVYRIPELPKPKTTAWDVICDALSLTFKATGVRYYPQCAGEAMRLIERRQNVLTWVVETGVNLENYTMHKSTEKIRTRIKLLSKENDVLASAVDSPLEQKLGSFQAVQSVNDEMNAAQLNEMVNSILDEKNKPEKTLSVSAIGIPEVITGVGVHIIIKELGIAKTFYVEEDTHTFQGDMHTMALKFTSARDMFK